MAHFKKQNIVNLLFTQVKTFVYEHILTWTLNQNTKQQITSECQKKASLISVHCRPFQWNTNKFVTYRQMT